MKLTMPALILMTLSGAALAQPPAPRTLDDRLTKDDGMVQVSDGLYARTTVDGEAYVAVGPAGHEALLDILRQIRADRAKQSAKPRSSVVESLISSIGQPHLDMTDTGDCNGHAVHGAFYVQALAGGGVGGGFFGASASAQNNDGFSPSINTTNHSVAETVDRFLNLTHLQVTTTHGPGAAANAAVFDNTTAACDADASATVTCPGHTTPAISAYAGAHKQGCPRNQ